MMSVCPIIPIWLMWYLPPSPLVISKSSVVSHSETVNFLDSLSPGGVSNHVWFVCFLISQWALHGQQDEQRRLLWFRKKRKIAIGYSGSL